MCVGDAIGRLEADRGGARRQRFWRVRGDRVAIPVSRLEVIEDLFSLGECFRAKLCFGLVELPSQRMLRALV